MKKIAFFFLATILTTGCSSQENKKNDQPDQEGQKSVAGQPKGTWKVDKEFDENGNMIHYDSIYSWSSSDDFGNLALTDRDSLLQAFQSRFFKHFTNADRFGFEPFMQTDSLFTQKFFNEDFFGSDFGKDFMDLDKMHERMDRMHQEFFERYRENFKRTEEEGETEQL